MDKCDVHLARALPRCLVDGLYSMYKTGIYEDGNRPSIFLKRHDSWMMTIRMVYIKSGWEIVHLWSVVCGALFAFRAVSEHVPHASNPKTFSFLLKPSHITRTLLAPNMIIFSALLKLMILSINAHSTAK